MYEARCYQKLDEPILVWLGLEFHEVVLAVGGGTGTALVTAFGFGLGFLGMVLGFAAGAGLVCLFRALRAGGPGAVFAKLYRWGVFEVLPVGLRPRYLLSLPGRGTRARFRLSPVSREEKDSVDRTARLYFGR